MDNLFGKKKDPKDLVRGGSGSTPGLKAPRFQNLMLKMIRRCFQLEPGFSELAPLQLGEGMAVEAPLGAARDRPSNPRCAPRNNAPDLLPSTAIDTGVSKRARVCVKEDGEFHRRPVQ